MNSVHSEAIAFASGDFHVEVLNQSVLLHVLLAYRSDNAFAVMTEGILSFALVPEVFLVPAFAFAEDILVSLVAVVLEDASVVVVVVVDVASCRTALAGSVNVLHAHHMHPDIVGRNPRSPFVDRMRHQHRNL